jgi:tripartite-type tricarboxylate transporter receptor subunit TctC
MAEWLSDRLGQPFIIENRPGAGFNIAAKAAVTAPPDGHTLLLVSIKNALNATLYDKLNFDFLRDIAPVAGLNRGAFGVMVAHPSFPVKSVPELIAYAKANPGKISYASGGNGSAPHLYGELFNIMAGINLVHVAHRGEAPAVIDVLTGKVPVMFDNLTALEYIRSDKLRALAVTSPTRLEGFPDIPAMADFVPGYAASGWNGFGAPRNTPPEIIDKLNHEINAGLASPKIQLRLAQFNSVSLSMTPTEFGKFLAEETEKWRKVIRAANTKSA